jgi:predicted HD phosphohydrolase
VRTVETEDVVFTHLAQATPDDWAAIHRDRAHYDPAGALLALHDSLRGLPTYGYSVNVYDHTVQAASRALRDGASDEMVATALLHDVADELAPMNHGPAAAALLEPWVSSDVRWLVHHHSLFQNVLIATPEQADAAARAWAAVADHPAAPMTEHFCRSWDAPAFDPDYVPVPMTELADVVRRVVRRAA